MDWRGAAIKNILTSCLIFDMLQVIVEVKHQKTELQHSFTSFSSRDLTCVPGFFLLLSILMCWRWDCGPAGGFRMDDGVRYARGPLTDQIRQVEDACEEGIFFVDKSRPT